MWLLLLFFLVAAPAWAEDLGELSAARTKLADFFSILLDIRVLKQAPACRASPRCYVGESQNHLVYGHACAFFHPLI